MHHKCVIFMVLLGTKITNKMGLEVVLNSFLCEYLEFLFLNHKCSHDGVLFNVRIHVVVSSNNIKQTVGINGIA